MIESFFSMKEVFLGLGSMILMYFLIFFIFSLPFIIFLYLILPFLYNFIIRIIGLILFRKSYEQTKAKIDKFVLTSISWGIKILIFYLLLIGIIFLISITNKEISSSAYDSVAFLGWGMWYIFNIINTYCFFSKKYSDFFDIYPISKNRSYQFLSSGLSILFFFLVLVWAYK